MGLFYAFKFQTRRAVFLLLATATTIAFGAAYKVQDVAVFFIPSFMLICIWAAIGLAPVFDQMAQRAARASWGVHAPLRLRPFFVLLWLLPVALIMLFEPVHSAVTGWSERDRSQNWQVYDVGRAMIDAVENGGHVIGLGGEVTLMRYFRDVQGLRPDLEVTRADAEQERYTALEAAMSKGQPVYLTRDLPGVGQRYSLDAAGPLVQVSVKATPGATPEGGKRMGSQPGATVILLDASIRPLPSNDRAARIALRWTAPEPVTEELKVSARLVNAAGETVVAEDAAPVHFTYPTTLWVAGETVDDSYDLLLPDSAAPGPYSALVILYRAADGAEIGRTTLGPLAIP
jgi:hypothetical protein